MNTLRKLMHACGLRKERRLKPRGSLREQMEMTDARLYQAVDEMEHEAQTTTQILRARRLSRSQ